MKVNPTVALTLILLALMGGAGIISAAWGYALGREALKGVTQPDVRSPTAGSKSAQSQPRHQEMMIVPEAKILEEVKGRISGNGATPPPENVQSNTAQPIQSGAVIPPVISPVVQPNAVQPTDLPPAFAPPADLPPESLPLDSVQPVLQPGDLSPSGFNPTPATNHIVGWYLHRSSTSNFVVSSTFDRVAASRKAISVANLGYGVEQISLAPFNRCG